MNSLFHQYFADRAFVALGVVFLLFAAASIVQSRRRHVRQDEAWSAFATQAAARGWRWESRPSGPKLPAGLAGDPADRLLAWLITGTHRERPWTVHRSLFPDRSGSSHGPHITKFRGLLASPPPFGIHICSAAMVRLMGLVPGATSQRRRIAEQIRRSSMESRVTSDDLAAIFAYPDQDRRRALPSALERAGYAAFVTKSGESQGADFLETIASPLKAWDATQQGRPLDMLIMGREIQITLRGVLDDFESIDRFVGLGLVALEAAERPR